MYLTTQTNYDLIELALFQDKQLIEKIEIDKKLATTLFLVELNRLLKRNNLNLERLEFIGVNQGPAPFTTLRVLISNINGISFGTKIPLIGVDGLKALLKERSTNQNITVALLNAFNKDVYFGIKEQDEIETGWINIQSFIKKFDEKLNKHNVLFVGNAVELFQDQIKKQFPNATLKPGIKYANLEQIAKMALAKFQKKEGISNKLMPLYLKDAIYTKI